MHEMQIILRRVRFRVALRTGTHRTACQPDGGSVRVIMKRQFSASERNPLCIFSVINNVPVIN